MLFFAFTFHDRVRREEEAPPDVEKVPIAAAEPRS
jgi:hypothetical protein